MTYAERIQKLDDTLRLARDDVGYLNADVYGVREIFDQLTLSLRYVNKLRDHYLCARCGEDIEDDETFVHHFKARIHTRCNEETP